MRINQPELEPRPNDVIHGVPYQEDGIYNEIEDTYLEVIDDADITNKHSDNYEMVDWYPCTIYVQHWLNIPLHILAYYKL